MTRILVRTLADARDTVRVLDATITATATRARVEGDTITLPEPVAVRLRRGELSSPLELEAPDGSWAWQFLVQPTGTRRMDALVFLRTFPDVGEIEWGDMTPVDPDTLTPLDPVPPSAAQVLLRAEEAVTAAEEAVEDATGALSVANTAVVSGAVVGDDLVLTRKNGQTIPAGNVRGLPGAGAPRTSTTGGRSMYVVDTVAAREQIIYGDTGWRDITSLLVNGWTGTVLLRRVGALVEIQWISLNSSAATADTYMSLPLGFRPRAYVAPAVMAAGGAYANPTFRAENGGSMRAPLTAPTIGAGAVYTSATWTTTNAWPTTLPGTASGTIPNT